MANGASLYKGSAQPALLQHTRRAERKDAAPRGKKFAEQRPRGGCCRHGIAGMGSKEGGDAVGQDHAKVFDLLIDQPLAPAGTTRRRFGKVAAIGRARGGLSGDAGDHLSRFMQRGPPGGERRTGRRRLGPRPSLEG